MRRIYFGLLVLASSAGFAAANFTFYTFEPAFDAAIAGLQQGTITFGNIPYGEYPALTTQGVTFTGDFPSPAPVVQVVDDSWTQTYFNSTGNALVSLDTIYATLPSGVSAVGFNVGASGIVATGFSGGAGLGVAGGGGMNVTLTPANPYPFLGVVSDAPFASVVITSSSFLTIGNFTFAGASVPEPSTSLLLAIPLATFAIRRRLQR